MKNKRNVKYWTDNEGFNWPYPSQNSSRMRTWITIDEICNEYPEFIDKVSDIIFDSDYPENMQNYGKTVAQFLSDNDWVSWKQFDSILRISNFKKNGWKYFYKNGDVIIVENGQLVTVKKNRVSFTFREKSSNRLKSTINNTLTDKELDKLYIRIFGHSPVFYETHEEGYEMCYDKEGSRYFTLPSSDSKLIDYI